MQASTDHYALSLAQFELENGLTRLGDVATECIFLRAVLGAVLAQDYTGKIFGWLGKRVRTELPCQRVLTLGRVRVYDLPESTSHEQLLSERILAAGGVAQCDSREGHLVGYLGDRRYLVLFVNVQPESTKLSTIDDADGLLGHPFTAKYKDFMNRMRQHPTGWRGAFKQPTQFLPEEEGFPFYVEIVSWSNIFLEAPEPPMKVLYDCELFGYK